MSGIAALCVATPITLTSAIAQSPANAMEQETKLPLGEPDLYESRTSAQVTPGVTYTRILRGKQSERDVYTVDFAFRATPEAAQAIAEWLKSQGQQPRIEPVLQRAADDPERGPLGYLVRVGSFTSEAEATNLRDLLAVGGYAGLRVVNTAEDGGATTGPWVVNVLEVDPAEFRGTLAPKLATGIVPGNEPLTMLAARENTLAAVNGGYFIIGPTDGTPGDLAGISVVGGGLVSEAVNGRTSLILPAGGKTARVAALSTQLTVTASDGVTREIDGVNRLPGLIRGCGGVGGDMPTERPKHDFTCTDANELIQFTPVFGASSEPGAGVEVALDSAGQVIELRNQRGGQIPINGSVLSGTGDAAGWLHHAQPGTKIIINTRVMANGEPLPTEELLGVINGGPRLLRNGTLDIPAVAEGFHWPENPEFYYRFGVRRNPRTLAGVTATGKLLLVTIDGRQPGWSVGASFKESAQVMRSLGTVDAVNLDGGGSTTMTVGRQLVTRPSDPTGERPIADAILIQP